MDNQITSAEKERWDVMYPESGLRNRLKLAFEWIPENCQRLLDGGCAYGSGVKHFARKSRFVTGIDPNPELLRVARERYPSFDFVQCSLEQTPFADESFDTIVLTDVLEHVRDERAALNEMFRLLAPGGTLVITTPHRGLFGFMDTDNYAYHLRTKLPRLYRWIYTRKHGTRPPELTKAGYESPHRHYALADFTKLLGESAFAGHYAIQSLHRGGLFVEVFTSNLFEALSLVCGVRLASQICKPLKWLSDVDYFLPYGCLSYNIGIRLTKRA